MFCSSKASLFPGLFNPVAVFSLPDSGANPCLYCDEDVNAERKMLNFVALVKPCLSGIKRRSGPRYGYKLKNSWDWHPTMLLTRTTRN